MFVVMVLAAMFLWPCVGGAIALLLLWLAGAAGLPPFGLDLFSLETALLCAVVAAGLAYLVTRLVTRDALAARCMGLLTLVATPFVLVALVLWAMSSLR